MIRNCCGLVPVLLMGFWATAASAADASRCAEIADPQARLICYDAVYPPKAAAPAPAVTRAPAPVLAPAVAPAPVVAAAPASPAAAPAQAATPPAVPSAAPPATPAAPAVTKGGVSTLFGLLPKKDKAKAETSLHAMVTQVQVLAGGQLITLNNGQVWQLTEYQREPFVKAEQGVVIDPASLGSFLMSAERGGQAVRVKRVR